MATAHSPRLAFLIKTVFQAIRVESDTALSAVGLSLPQLAVLALLRQSPGASNAALARAAFVTPQSMGSILGTMTKRGFIRRTPDRTNRRILRTTLTAKGVKMLQAADAALSHVEERLVTPLNAEEERLMREWLQRCANALRTEP